MKSDPGASASTLPFPVLCPALPAPGQAHLRAPLPVPGPSCSLCMVGPLEAVPGGVGPQCLPSPLPPRPQGFPPVATSQRGLPVTPYTMVTPLPPNVSSPSLLTVGRRVAP